MNTTLQWFVIVTFGILIFYSTGMMVGDIIINEPIKAVSYLAIVWVLIRFGANILEELE